MTWAGHDDAISIALRVAAAVEAAGGTYFVGGSLASSLDGKPRSTNDIDFVIDLPVGKVAALAAGVLRTHAENLDQGYLDVWSRRLGVEALLAKARRQAVS